MANEPTNEASNPPSPATPCGSYPATDCSDLKPCPVCGVVPDRSNFRTAPCDYDYAEGWRIYCTNRVCPSRPNVCSFNRREKDGEDGGQEDIIRRWNALTREEAESKRYAHCYVL